MKKRKRKSKNKNGPKIKAAATQQGYNFVVAASTRIINAPGKSEATDAFGVINAKGDKVTFACGHEDFAFFMFDIWGEQVELTDEYLASRQDCSACHLERIRKTFRRCSLCGFPIRPGAAVATYADDPRFKPEWKTVIGTSGNCVLGCLRPNCCPSAGFFAGNWDGEQVCGIVGRTPSALSIFSPSQTAIGAYYERPL